MNIEEIRTYCLNKKAVSESFPFDEDTLVFKIGNKMFALASLEKVPLSINLKCRPEKALELREQYPSILPGFHMNKKHWNTLIIDGSLPNQLVIELIDESYNLVLKTMTAKMRKKLGIN